MTFFLYNTAILLYKIAVHIAALFQSKAALFVKGRRHIFNHIEESLKGDTHKRVWIHCASLGEFEQARPVIERLRTQHAHYNIVLTFFSPSGYEVQKNYAGADYVFYLPMDTQRNAQRFLDIVQPQCALFVKYEFWFHYLHQLSVRKIPVILFSALFQPRHPFFHWYGSLYRRMLSYYQQIFVQDEASAQLLASIGITEVQIAGDTRFDRSWEIMQIQTSFTSVEVFKGNHRLIIAGSTWKEDEILLQKAILQLPEEYKLLIAPHEIKPDHIKEIESLFPGNHCLWNADKQTLKNKRIAIVSEMGYLSRLYRYADIVWIGGGFTRTGIHNIIEPAVYGKPVCFGPRYNRYREAIEMLKAGAVHTVADAGGLVQFIKDKNTLHTLGNNAKHYVARQLGATAIIMDYLREKCLDNRE